MRVYGITGWKNSGKTTLLERLVAEITSRGFSVSTLKHAHHSFDVDHPGKDSYRHREAGAREVLLTSKNRWALMHENRNEDEPCMNEMLQKFSPVDLVLIEGFKGEAHHKIEVTLETNGSKLLAANDSNIRAIAAENDIEKTNLPTFARDDVSQIADFILREVELV